ncbi:MAG: hypothetical protein JW726_18065 [Anaerolineales bacterium]|nr:hypothetical protein [Anaerolineales bacterium]
MPETERTDQQNQLAASGRRGFLYTVLGGGLAAVAGWISGAFSGDQTVAQQESSLRAAESRISALEAQVAALAEQPMPSSEGQQLATLEGDRNQRIIFNKSELSVINPEGVLLNLVATHGHVGIRFYKDFDFGNEQETSPWHMGYIEGVDGYQGLAILRDWRFTAALWDEDGKLTLGRLNPHPPANQPARARFQVRGTVDEIQAIVEANPQQTADIFQILGTDGVPHLTVDGAGNIHIGSQDNPKDIFLHDTADGSAYSLRVTNGSLILSKT